MAETQNPGQVVQFDLAQRMNEKWLNDTKFGRRRPPKDLCRNVYEALVWDAPNDYELGKTKKKGFDQVTQIQMERSPTKWKTMYRDQFRKFTESPGRDYNQGEEIEGQDIIDDAQNDGGLQPNEIQLDVNKEKESSKNDNADIANTLQNERT